MLIDWPRSYEYDMRVVCFYSGMRQYLSQIVLILRQWDMLPILCIERTRIVCTKEDGDKFDFSFLWRRDDCRKYAEGMVRVVATAECVRDGPQELLAELNCIPTSSHG